MNMDSMENHTLKRILHSYYIRCFYFFFAFFIITGDAFAAADESEDHLTAVPLQYLKLEIRTITYDNQKLKIRMRLQNISNEKIILKHIYWPLSANCIEEDLKDTQTVLGHPLGNLVTWKNIELKDNEFIEFDMINFGTIKQGDHIICVTFVINELLIDSKNLTYSDVRINSNHYNIYIEHDINTEKFLDKTYHSDSDTMISYIDNDYLILNYEWIIPREKAFSCFPSEQERLALAEELKKNRTFLSEDTYIMTKCVRTNMVTPISFWIYRKIYGQWKLCGMCNWTKNKDNSSPYQAKLVDDTVYIFDADRKHSVEVVLDQDYKLSFGQNASVGKTIDKLLKFQEEAEDIAD